MIGCPFPVRRFILKPSLKGGAKRRSLFVLGSFIILSNLFTKIYVRNENKVAKYLEKNILFGVDSREKRFEKSHRERNLSDFFYSPFFD